MDASKLGHGIPADGVRWRFEIMSKCYLGYSNKIWYYKVSSRCDL